MELDITALDRLPALQETPLAMCEVTCPASCTNTCSTGYTCAGRTAV